MTEKDLYTGKYEEPPHNTCCDEAHSCGVTETEAKLLPKIQELQTRLSAALRDLEVYECNCPHYPDSNCDMNCVSSVYHSRDLCEKRQEIGKLKTNLETSIENFEALIRLTTPTAPLQVLKGAQITLKQMQKEFLGVLK